MTSSMWIQDSWTQRNRFSSRVPLLIVGLMYTLYTWCYLFFTGHGFLDMRPVAGSIVQLTSLANQNYR